MTFNKSWLVSLLAVCVLAVSGLVHAQAQVNDPAADPTDPINVGVAAFNRGHWATAMRAWRPAAEQGNAMAQNNVGYLHEQGLGVPQSYVQALSWYPTLFWAMALPCSPTGRHARMAVAQWLRLKAATPKLMGSVGSAAGSFT